MKNVSLFALMLVLGSLHALKAQDTTGVLKVQDTTAVCPSPEEVDKNTLLNIFPNPTNGTLKITYASLTECPPPGWGGVLLVNVINSNGKVVYTESISDFEGEYDQTIDLSTHEKGNYFVEIVTGKQKRVKRVVLN